MQSFLIDTIRWAGVGCAALTALYWGSFAVSKLGNYLVYSGLWQTDSVGVPVHPSVSSGTPSLLVLAFWLVTAAGTIAWTVVVVRLVIGFFLRQGQ